MAHTFVSELSVPSLTTLNGIMPTLIWQKIIPLRKDKNPFEPKSDGGLKTQKEDSKTNKAE